jgi:hypothetical protein
MPAWSADRELRCHHRRPEYRLFLEADNPGQRDCTAHGKVNVEDVNHDGRPDLLLRCEIRQTGIDNGDTTACLTGKTFAVTYGARVGLLHVLREAASRDPLRGGAAWRLAPRRILWAE